ncbi:MFS transporter [Methanocella paludicola SANAE]|uniref:MFS transporter n=1 Tax=Methanocella paludicola (strain DSM 17711 / JCM 13418 / NBRC 101707 / SANAE) TaxID=304371 RepID=D1YWI8_METPS|nr:MFS transporter [Methanocella paludicola]BAI60810.1 MFS transporter [Methanocella paludicola SANAE]
MAESVFRRYDRQVWILVAGSLLNTFGTSIAYPFVSLYLYKYQGVSMTDIGLALLAAAAAGGLVSVGAGELCDRFGRKIMLNIGLFFQMVSFALLGYAIMAGWGYSEFMMLMVLKEISGGLYRNVPQVMVADTVEPGDRNGAFSLLRIGGNLGFALGPIFGGILASYSYAAMFIITALTSGAYMLISLYLLHDTRPDERDIAAHPHHDPMWSNTPFIIFCAASAIGSLVYSNLFTTFGTFSGGFIDVSESMIGLIFSLNGFMVVVFQLPVAYYLERFRMTTSLILGSLIYASGFALVGFCNSVWMLFMSMFIITVGELVVTPASQTLLSEMAPPEARGRYMNVAGFIGSGGNACGPAVGGFLMDGFSKNIIMMWLILGALEVVCAGGYLALRLRLSSKMDDLKAAGA